MSDFAQALADARRSGQQCLQPLPEGIAAMDDALVHQNAALDAFGSPRIGWKVGATNEGAQKAFNLDGPFFGPMVEASLADAGGAVAKTETVMAVEPEYAFKMARDFPANGESITREGAAEAVAACHLALEIIGRCNGHADAQTGLGLIADFAGNARFVVGPEVADWQNADLVGTAVKGMIDGQEAANGSGANVMGDPLTSLVWMAEQLAARGESLKAGDWVSTGTCTAPVPAAAGTEVSASFGEFGTVSVSFT